MFYPSLSFTTKIVADQYWTCIFLPLNSLKIAVRCQKMWIFHYINFSWKMQVKKCENSSFHMGCFDRPSLMYGNNATNHTKSIFRTNTHKHDPACVSTFTAHLASSSHANNIFCLSFNEHLLNERFSCQFPFTMLFYFHSKRKSINSSTIRQRLRDGNLVDGAQPRIWCQTCSKQYFTFLVTLNNEPTSCFIMQSKILEISLTGLIQF